MDSLKAFIKAPEIIQKIQKLAPGVFAEASPLQDARDNFCGFVEGLATSFGCAREFSSNFVTSICDMANNILAALSCDPVVWEEPPPDDSCEFDSECGVHEVCVGGDCIPDPNDCTVYNNCDPWQECNQGTGDCDDLYDHCHNTGCPDDWRSCNDQTGNCELKVGRCEVDVDCPTEAPYCDTSDHWCKGCVDPNDCPEGSYCEIDNTCEPCKPAGDTTCNFDHECCGSRTCNSTFGCT